MPLEIHVYCPSVHFPPIGLTSAVLVPNMAVWIRAACLASGVAACNFFKKPLIQTTSHSTLHFPGAAHTPSGSQSDDGGREDQSTSVRPSVQL